MGNATLVRVERVEIKGWSGSIHLESNNRPIGAAKLAGSYAYLISQEEYHRLVADSERLAKIRAPDAPTAVPASGAV